MENESEILSHIEEDSVLGHSSMVGTESNIGNRLILSLEFFFFSGCIFLYPVWKVPERKKFRFKAKRKRLKDPLFPSVLKNNII